MRLLGVVLLLAACSGPASNDGGAAGGATAGGATAGGATAGGATAGGPTAGGASGGTGGGSATAGGTGGAGGIPMFVASGHVGRTIVSCDDGRTWVANRSDENGFVCFVTGGNPDGGSEDCDHNAGAGHGVTFSNGWFVASYGWGPPGGVRRSRDGVSWAQTLAGTTFQGVVSGDGVVLASARGPRVSADDGLTWDAGGPPAVLAAPDGGPIYNVRAQGFGDGVFYMYANDSDRSDLVLSRDRGLTWTRPSTLPPECARASAFASNGGSTVVFVNQDGFACRTTDRGATFSASPLGGTPSSGPVWTGAGFIAWGQLPAPQYTWVAFRSSDGASWTTTALVGRRPLADGGVQSMRPEVGPVGFSPLTGTFVSVRGGWMNWYARQEFYRSADGVTWDFLPASAFTGSHPLSQIAFGYAAPSAACP